MDAEEGTVDGVAGAPREREGVARRRRRPLVIGGMKIIRDPRKSAAAEKVQGVRDRTGGILLAKILARLTQEKVCRFWHHSLGV